MLYTIYFDESGKLDKNIDSTYSYYAALIVSNDELEKINTELKEIYPNIERDSELLLASSRIEQLTPINFEHFRSQTFSDDVSFGS